MIGSLTRPLSRYNLHSLLNQSILSSTIIYSSYPSSIIPFSSSFLYHCPRSFSNPSSSSSPSSSFIDNNNNNNININIDNNKKLAYTRRINASPANTFDLVVIGSGPAGQKAAINAAKKKKKVCIIDKKSWLGGVCIHTGTIPSKTFREAVLHLTNYRQRGFVGKGSVERNQVSSRDILNRVYKVEGWETETIMDQLHRNGVKIIDGHARFLDGHHVEIIPSTSQYSLQRDSLSENKKNFLDYSPTGGITNNINNNNDNFSVSPSSSFSCPSLPPPPPATLTDKSEFTYASDHPIVRGENILIACGTRPAHNPLYPFDSPLVFDSDEILWRGHWDRVRHLIVVGSGVVAMEYASMFNALPGCRVTIIDEKPSFLDFVDSEIVATLRHVMQREGAVFRLGEKVKKVDTHHSEPQGVKVTMESGKIIYGDALFYAVGRQANSDSLNLSAAGVQTAKRGLISVNEYFQTNISHIYACGDVIGFPALASTAMEQGRLASSHMFSESKPFHPVFPYGIYTIPEISVIGKSEQQLTAEKISYEVGRAKFDECAKGQMVGGQHIDGFLKLLFCPSTKKLLGVAAIGESAAEIIHIGQVVLAMGGTIEYLRDSVFNYPTMAEVYRIAALDGLGKLSLNKCFKDNITTTKSK